MPTRGEAPMRATSRRTGIFVLAAVALVAANAAGAWAAEKAQASVIVISWDGVQREHLQQLLDAGRLPNLARLAAEGAFIPMEVTNHKTDTKAGHTEMLTGYGPDVTGVYNNAKYGAIPAGLSIFERVEDAFGDDGITTVFLTGKSHHIGSLPAGRRKVKGKKKKKAMQPAEPWNIARKNIDVWDGDKSRHADEVGALAFGHLNEYKKKRFLFFIHFSDPDHAGHKFGENSAEHEKAIILCDTWLGKLRGELAELGIDGRTALLVTTDHGFDEGARSHKNAPHIWLAANRKSNVKSADQMDVAPTVLKLFGVDTKSAKPPLPGKPLVE